MVPSDKRESCASCRIGWGEGVEGSCDYVTINLIL